MGMFDDLIKQVAPSVGKALGSHPELVQNLTKHISSKQVGGLSGLVGMLQKKGLGDIVNSWVGTGSNLPVSADQIQKALGSDTVKNLAAKVGITPQAAAAQLTTLLPMLVDKLTPDGKIPK
jgi:uncharacterized protein YidB (DUF937 family)